MFEQILGLFLEPDAVASAVEWAGAIATVVLSAKAVTIITPSKTDDRIYDLIMKAINVLALNVGKAKNADDV